MPGFTVANLRDIEDSAVEFGYAPAMSARFARGALEAEQTGLSLQRLAPNCRGAFAHKHGAQEEIYVIIAGGGRMKAGDEVVPLRQWDAIRVAAEVTRMFEAGDDGLELLAFGAASSGGMGDAQMVDASEFWPA
jgi:uncharacterized cupin superfamily protein